MTDKMNIWNSLRTVPVENLKKITGGRLNGKSDINPQWRFQRMTEIFGPCGVGWRYTIEKLWTEPGNAGEVCAFAQVNLYAGGESIPGIGGSMLIAQEKGGLYTSDEAFKMAVTDALSVAMKALGVAADIYLGKFDGAKYQTEAPAPAAPRPPMPTPPDQRPPSAPPQGAPQRTPPPPPPVDDGDHFCTVHQCKFYRREKDGAVWYSHKIEHGPDAGRYCNEERKPAPPAPAPAPAAPTLPPNHPDNDPDLPF